MIQVQMERSNSMKFNYDWIYIPFTYNELKEMV